MSLHPLLGMLLVLGMLGALTGALRFWQVKSAPHPELVRKLLHIGMGLVTLSFPLLFDASWPVIALAVLAVGAMLALRHVAPLRERLGGVVHAVARESSGELYFPVAIALVFTLAAGVPVLYAVPVLLLTLADATAALIGVRYGTLKLATLDGGFKSVEGAVAFFTVAFLCTHVSLLLATDVGRVETLLIGLEVGFLVMLVELVAWRGLDNLFIPLFSFALLHDIERMQAAELIERLAFLVLLSVFVLLWRKRTTLEAGALIASVLVAHVFWTVGGLLWLAPPVACFATYALLWPEDRVRRGRIHDLRAALSFAAVGLAWLLLATRLPERDWSYLGASAFAVQLAVTGLAATDRPGGDAWAPRRLVQCALVGWIVPFLPYVLLRGLEVHVVQLAGAALPAVAAALLAFNVRWVKLRETPYSMQRWVTQAAASAVGSLLALAPWLLLPA
jgi:phytol kinase